jgi:hypothetical protein
LTTEYSQLPPTTVSIIPLVLLAAMLTEGDEEPARTRRSGDRRQVMKEGM